MKTVKETTWKVVEEYQNGELTRVTQDIKETIYEHEDEKSLWQVIPNDSSAYALNCDKISGVIKTEEDTISGVAGVN